MAMLVSYSKRFVFVHLPRTAGRSISQALLPFGRSPPRHWWQRLLAIQGVQYFLPHQTKRFRVHTTAAQVRRQLPRQVYSTFFKFAFVRNPWDLLVSSYHRILNRPVHHRHRRVKQLAGFPEYVEYEIARNKLSQRRFLVDGRGRLILDFVGKFETLTADFAQVCRVLGLTVSLSHLNATARGDYRNYYDQRLRELVARHFREDIDLFEYTFDGTAPTAASLPRAVSLSCRDAGQGTDRGHLPRREGARNHPVCEIRV